MMQPPPSFAQVANMTTPWINPAGQVVTPNTTAVYVSPVVQLLVIMSAGFSAYHGYKRNRDNVGWGFAWGALGAIFPVITPIVAVAEGYAKPEKK